MNRSAFKNITALSIALFISMALAACSSDNNAEPTAKARRTIIIYMLADNSLGLGGYDSDDIAEMETWARKSDFNECNIIVYHVAAGGTATLEQLTPQGMKILKKYAYNPDIYSVDIDKMRAIMADMVNLAPAKSYGAIMWSHSNGWQENKYSRSWGQDRNMTMKISSLAAGMADLHWDFIYFDSCHSITVEVVYELRSLTPIIAGSTTELPSPGMPYDKTLGYFVSDKADIEEAARTTFNYYNSMSGQMRSCTMSVIDTRHLNELAYATRAIMATAPELPDNYRGIPYMVTACTIFDMADYIHNLQVTDQSLIDRWDNVLKSCVIYKAATPSMWQGLLDLSHYCGMGSYFATTPHEASMMGYMNQSWWKDVVSYNPLLSE